VGNCGIVSRWDGALAPIQMGQKKTDGGGTLRD